MTPYFSGSTHRHFLSHPAARAEKIHLNIPGFAVVLANDTKLERATLETMYNEVTKRTVRRSFWRHPIFTPLKRHRRIIVHAVRLAGEHGQMPSNLPALASATEKGIRSHSETMSESQLFYVFLTSTRLSCLPHHV